MPFRAWLFAVAIGLIASHAASQDGSNNENEAQNAETDTTDQQAESDTPSLPVRIIESEEAAKARQRSENQSRKLQENDLVAQKGMQKATESIEKATWRMFWVSVVSAAFVAIGTALLIWTLCLTRATNRAAWKMAQETRSIGNEQLRPFAFCQNIAWEMKGQHVLIGIKNTGKSPAENVSVHYTITRLEDGRVIEDVVPRGGVNEIGHVFPSATVFTRSAHPIWSPQVHGQARARVEGKASYWDPVFKKNRAVKFLFIADGMQGQFIAHSAKENADQS